MHKRVEPLLTRPFGQGRDLIHLAHFGLEEAGLAARFLDGCNGLLQRLALAALRQDMPAVPRQTYSRSAADAAACAGYQTGRPASRSRSAILSSSSDEEKGKREASLTCRS